MTLDQENVAFKYSKILNAAWLDEEDPSALAYTFDGENLNPLTTDRISPFVATFHLPQDVEQFRKHQGIRFYAARDVWPRIERMAIHLERKQSAFFRDELRELEYEGPLANDRERLEGLIWAIERYGMLFGPTDPAPRLHIASRIRLAEQTAPQAVKDVVAHFRSKNRHASITNELHSIRQRWAQIFWFLFPVYAAFYWEDGKHSLDQYTIGQKRFDELKPFYVDCFETLCRISSIAAALEGVVTQSAAIVPSKKGMTIGAFEVMANGSKPDILKNLAISDALVPFMDSRLRNGMGHNAASYSVSRDVVLYANENDKGKVDHEISYIRFCEKVVRLYVQLELVSMYVNWLNVECS